MRFLQSRVAIRIGGLVVFLAVSSVWYLRRDSFEAPLRSDPAVLQPVAASLAEPGALSPAEPVVAAEPSALPDLGSALALIGYSFKGPVQGTALPAKPPAVREGAEKGRVMEMEGLAAAKLESWAVGQEVHLPTPNGDLVGVVNLVQKDDGGWVRVGGSLPEQKGSFTLAAGPNASGGLIMLPAEGLAYEVVTEPDRRVVLVERRLSDKRCLTLVPSRVRKLASAARAGTTSEAPPLLSSRPNAPAVVYLDFDGETVTDPGWNDGKTIVAPPFAVTAAEITEVFNRVKEDYAPFNIDITTSLSRYNAVPANRRTHCIITSNDIAAPGAGGVAYVDAFSSAGVGLSSTVPCWVFNDSVVGMAEAISHEVGHALGLSHDGRTSPNEGYYGGAGTGATGWAPIMGVGYDRSLVQWSKGEYKNADNKEDDLAIITRAVNGVAYVTDEAGNTAASAAPLNISGTTISQTGVITGSGDGDYFQFTSAGGAISITAVPSSVSPNLDILMELRNSADAIVTSSNPLGELGATLSVNLTAGTYYLRIAGTGKGNVLVDGFSSYGSLGPYTLSGTISGVALVPAITSAAQAVGRVGDTFSYQIVATNTATSYAVTGSLPAGVTLNSATGVISGTPTVAGAYPVSLVATNSKGSGTLALTFKVSSQVISLAEAIDLPSATVTSGGNADWFTQSAVTFDGVDAASSGVISDNQTTSMKMSVTGPIVVGFRWKVDSEPMYDTLSFVVDGTVAAVISGATDWALKSVSVGGGAHQIEWRYGKDSSMSTGSDAGWVDGVTLTAPKVQRLVGDLAFGKVETSSIGARNVTIFNDGSTVLTVSGISYPEGFSGAWSGQIAGGSSQSVAVTFAPTSERVYSGTLALSSDAVSGGSTLPLSGEGVVVVTPLVSDVAVTGISGVSGSSRAFKITVPTGSSGLKVVTSGGTGDLDLYLKKAGLPTDTVFDLKSDGASSAESVSVTNPGAGDWFVVLIGYEDYSGVSLKATVSVPPSMVAVGVSSSGNGTVSGGGNYTIGSTVVVRGAAAAGFGFLSWTENGTVVSTVPEYSFVLRGARVLVANFSSALSLKSNVPFNSAMGALNSQVPYKITVPSGISRMTITTSGGSGDVDLYLKRGSAPGVQSFDYRSANVGNFETLLVVNPTAGDWFVLLRGYRAYAGVTLKAVLTPKSTSQAAPESATAAALAQMVGTYDGLLGDGALRLLGRLRVQVTAGGAFSSTAILDGVAYNLSGKFDEAGRWKGSVRVGTVAMPITLAADLVGQSLIRGVIAWDGIAYEVLARVVANGSPDEAGTYPVSLVPTPDVAGGKFPTASGSAVITVRKDGSATLVGTLGDGTRVSASGNLSPDGKWPMYIPLYRGAGAIGGWWVFEPWKAGERVKGSLRWIKRAGDKQSAFPDGFNGLVAGEGAM